MNTALDFLSRKRNLVGYIVISACLLAGLFLAGFHLSAEAAEIDSDSIQLESLDQLSTCDIPSDWNQTTRVKNPQNPTKEWKFFIVDPQADVTLNFFYYQDYDKSGCPFDCATGECQSDEGGKGETPLGMFYVIDGNEGANRGTKKLEGRLSSGTYRVIFTATGNPGSINVGLNVRLEPVPTPTLVPTKTPTATEIPPTETATPTPTEIEVTPSDTPTSTYTPTNPPVTETTTPPPKESPTATPTRKPPSTLPPPTAFPGSPSPQILIPVTGVSNQESGLNGWILIPMGIGLLGIGLAFYGIVIRHNQKQS